MPVNARRLAELDGLIAAVVVDLERGVIERAACRGERSDIELAALHDGAVLERVHALVLRLDPSESLQSVVITLAGHHHVILPSRRSESRFLYLVMERSDAALGLLLHGLTEVGAV